VSTRPKILICIDWFYPAFKAGGPVKSVFNIITNLRGDFNFFVLTSDADIDGEISDVKTNIWLEKDGFKIMYLNKPRRRLKSMKKIITQLNPSIIHVNSMFSMRFTIFPLIISLSSDMKFILAPRGMLSESALRIKPAKKKLFVVFFKQLIARKSGFIWHATSKIEKEEIQLQFNSSKRIGIAENLASSVSKIEEHSRWDKGQIRLVCIARFSVIKNQLWLIDLVRKNANLEFTIDYFGPKEDQDYWSRCESALAKDGRQNYKGVVSPERISECIRQYHFLVSPSASENYGHVIVESFCCGVPVVISTGTPWRKLSEKEIGYDLSLSDEKKWVDTLELISSRLDEERYKSKVLNCLKFAENDIHHPAVLNRSKSLFLD
jgi:glycosyltransferase involved in cell wall biosynthesis